ESSVSSKPSFVRAGNRRVLVDFNKTPGFQELGLPDGMTIDVNDKIWMACFEGSAVIQIDPETAKILTKIEFPAKYTTSCCFGGRELRRPIRHDGQLSPGRQKARGWPTLQGYGAGSKGQGTVRVCRLAALGVMRIERSQNAGSVIPDASWYHGGILRTTKRYF
ncbi:hypothetical protein MTO96_050978, partial [Rhipicephalus appendiculatus]